MVHVVTCERYAILRSIALHNTFSNFFLTSTDFSSSSIKYHSFDRSIIAYSKKIQKNKVIWVKVSTQDKIKNNAQMKKLKVG